MRVSLFVHLTSFNYYTSADFFRRTTDYPFYIWLG